MRSKHEAARTTPPNLNRQIYPPPPRPREQKDTSRPLHPGKVRLPWSFLKAHCPHGQSARGGYIIFCWKGDHEPRHVHVRTSGGKKLGRVNLNTLQGMEGWTPERKLVEIIQELQKEGRL